MNIDTLIAPTPSEVKADNMIFIKGGTFEMGDVFDDNHYKDEKPVHEVTVSDFYLSSTVMSSAFIIDKMRKKFPGIEATYMLHFMCAVPACITLAMLEKSDNLPLTQISWYDSISICNWLSLMDGFEAVYTIDGENITVNWEANGYRLPTEAEWEYAAREGGKKVRFGNGQNILRSDEVNFDARSTIPPPYSEVGQYRGHTVPVDSFAPNALWLYNMSGNVWEWCQDFWDSEYYRHSPSNNPRGPETGNSRVVRGGSWSYYPEYCRSAFRNSLHPDNRYYYVGFRVCRVLGELPNRQRRSCFKGQHSD